MLDYPLLRYLFGCVRFRVSGGFAARFMNLCDSEHLHVWHLQQDASGVASSVAVRDYRRLRVIARRAGMTLSKYYETDRVVEDRIRKKIYDIDEINLELFDRDLALLGSYA